MEGKTGERRELRELFFCMRGSIGGKSVMWTVRSEEWRARARLGRALVGHLPRLREDVLPYEATTGAQLDSVKRFHRC